MKKLAFYTLTAVLLCGLAGCLAPPAPAQLPTATTAQNLVATAQPSPRPTNTLTPALHSPNGPPLRQFAMFPGGNGWGLIYNQLLLTHDGGLSWFSVPIPEAQINESSQVFLRGQNNIWLLAGMTGGRMGMFHSSDGGGSWQAAEVPFTGGQLVFVDEVGYFLDTTQTTNTDIYTSGDDGLSWNRIFPATNDQPGNSMAEEGMKTGLAFINSQQGWLGLAAQKQKAVLYATSNGGANWLPQEIPLPQNIASLQTSIQPAVFFTGNPNEGLLPVDFVPLDGGQTQRVFYFTADAGATWSPGEPVDEGGAFTFVDAQTGWVWGKRGLLFTSNGAQTWQALPVAFGRSEHATGISFVDAKNGWLLTADVNNRVRMYKTEDGGSTWVALNP